MAASLSRSRCPSPSPLSPVRRAVAGDKTRARSAFTSKPRSREASGKPHLRAVLWDLDGTLTDSVRLVVETMSSVIAAHGGPLLPYEKVGELTGLPLDAMFRLLWPDIGDADVERYRVEYRTLYDAVAIPATRLYRGARTTLRDFHAAGVLQATVTGKRAADCERILRGLGIKKDIEVYLGGDSAPRPKPAPDLAQHAMT
ncbi:MAG: HAD family hydrolase, partial [Chloroflexi bacterium]